MGKKFMVGQIFEEFLKAEGQLTPWMEKGAQNLLAQVGSRGAFWILITTYVFPSLGGDN
jgi:hypothetical protein